MTTAVSFDFAARRITTIEPEAVPAAVAGGAYCWIDIDSLAEAERLCGLLGLENAAVERVVADQNQGQITIGRACIDCTFVETAFHDRALVTGAMHLILANGFLVTAHAQESALLKHLSETIEEDFQREAQSGGFLLFEIVDHLIHEYRQTLSALSAEIDGIQRTLLGDVGDEILTDVSELTRALLEYRNAVVTARETVHELATRLSPYVAPSTQPYLERQTAPLSRLAGDAATERTVLSESLNLYMGIVSHRTNRVVNRLTVVSMIFLPLNFLAAVYGMNFHVMPELGWRYGYPAFWAVSSLLVVLLLIWLKRRRLF